MKIKAIKPFLGLLVILSLASCEKNTLEPSSIEAPRIYFQALFNGVPFNYKAGEKTYLANSFRLLNNHDSLLMYTFAIEDYANSSKTYVEISINNFCAPYKNIDSDIDSTIKAGSFKYGFAIPKPLNPKHLSEVTINWYNDLQERYSTNDIDQKYSWFNIVSVTDTLYKGLSGSVNLKKVVIDFNCLLFNESYGDTLRLSQGRAVGIF